MKESTTTTEQNNGDRANRLIRYVESGVGNKYLGLGRVSGPDRNGVTCDNRVFGTGTFAGVEIKIGNYLYVVYLGEDNKAHLLDLQMRRAKSFREKGGDPQKTEVKIGRNLDNDMVIVDNFVSREHVNITYKPDPGRFIIKDLNSSNGTFVRGLDVDSVSGFFDLIKPGYNVDDYTEMTLGRLIRKGRLQAWTVDESDWRRNPRKGRKGFEDLARTWNIRQDAISFFAEEEKREVAGRSFTYLVDNKGNLVLGDIGKSPQEVGIKHRQLGRAMEREGSERFILGGNAVFSARGDGVIINNRSGSFFGLKHTSDGAVMQKIVDLLSIKWGLRVTYRSVDKKDREIMRVISTE